MRSTLSGSFLLAALSILILILICSCADQQEESDYNSADYYISDNLSPQAVSSYGNSSKYYPFSYTNHKRVFSDEPKTNLNYYGWKSSTGSNDEDELFNSSADEHYEAPASAYISFTPRIRDSEAVLWIWPYIQESTAHSLEIAWETNLFSTSRVEVVVNGGEPQLFEGETFKITPLISEWSGEHLGSLGWEHIVKIDGLEPGSSVEYTIISLATPNGPHFTSTPGGDLKFVAYGDTNGNPDAHNIVAWRISAEWPELVIHTGDMFNCGYEANCGVFSLFTKLVWYSPRSTLVPVPGNHDSQAAASMYYEYFYSYFIDVEDTEAPEGCYEVRYGDLYVLVLNTALSMEDGSDMHKYAIRKLMAAAEDDSIKYRLVGIHSPLYTFSEHPWSEYYSQEAKRAFHQLMLDYGVMAVLSGHNHCYEHFNVDGVTYLTLGGGGSTLVNPYANIDENDEQYHLMSASAYHYAVFNSNGNDLDVIVKKTGDLSTIDSFTIEAR